MSRTRSARGARLAAWLGVGWFVLSALFFAAITARPARAAEGDDAWGNAFGWPGVDNLIYAMTVYHGELIAAGSFRDAGGVTVERIARWDGVSWHRLGDGLLLPSSFDEPFVSALTVYDDQLIAGGYFTLAGGVVAQHVARWDGTSWAPLGDGFDSTVQSLAVSGGSLYAGGEFTHSGLAPISRIARWDGTSWVPLGAGLDGVPWSLASYGGMLVAGGDFTSAGGTAANHLAAWDGTDWLPLGGGTRGGRAGSVTCLTVFRGELIAGGYFDSAGVVAASGVAAWDGSSWHALGQGVNPLVISLATFDDRLFVGGNLYTAGGGTVEGITEWDGSAWSPLATRTGRTQGSSGHMVVFAMTTYDDALIVAGDFDVAQEMPAVRIARWDGTGWDPLGLGLSDRYYLSWVSCLTHFDGRLMIGGQLAHGENSLEPSVDIRAWDGRRMDLFEWRVSASFTPEVTAFAVYGGDLVAAGTFTSIGGVAAGYIARWDGAAWQPLGAVPDAPVQALTLYGGELIAGGAFTQIGGVAASHVASWDGAAWHPMGAGVDGTVAAFTTFGTDLIAGGYFTTASGQPAAHIARWDGAAWDSVGTGIDGEVRALVVYHDELFAGGLFTTAGGFPADNLARWDGSQWSGLGLGADDRVSTLAVFQDQLFAGGYFDHIGGVPAESIARWNGGAWNALGSGLSDPTFCELITTVFALEPEGDTLYVGGRFELAGGKPAFNLTTWSGDSLAPPTPLPPPHPPMMLAFEANRPNPFSTATTFWFALPTATHVRLTLHDLFGRRVATIVDGDLPAGEIPVPWTARDDDGRALESGIYFARFAARGVVRTRKVAIVH